ncbi:MULTISPECIES: homoserine dehydrogenase [Atopobiaceae]|uniref:Homoserine dehydrogenase n=1 Tax=Parafannyhessea umbonata TaxID=604330 RepID=A0A1H6K2D3_9ACTN|nr:MULTISPECIES: homoserine dehydrogenase [Atopobiaceae]SEH68967.1 homoserine dehydrogenase [Parafannyhessea umbonata]SJZ53736.1 homoserine dehydrogenase [Olsenella sp. KH1P3]
MKIAILGHGTVGRGVDEIITNRLEEVEVARILELPDRLTDERMTSDYSQIVGDPSIDLVVECMGGLEPAHTFIMDALAAGKSVVTSNKAVVAAYFEEFARQARTSGASLLIEASVGGGIPWIASIEKARRIDEVISFYGIMNGTTNYIVDAMVKEGADFEDVLRRAQELGYAERDPSADIDGIDVKNKTIISASVAFDVACTSDFPVTGIRTLTKADLDALRKLGRGVKLLGRGVMEKGSYAVAVEPVAVPLDSLEANVPSNFNLVTFDATTVGELKFYGQGAGMLPTGNAMVQDVLDFAAGRRPSYDFSSDLAYDPTLLTSDYVFRTKADVAGALEIEGGLKVVRGATAQDARAILETALASDPTSFMAALPQED